MFGLQVEARLLTELECVREERDLLQVSSPHLCRPRLVAWGARNLLGTGARQHLALPRPHHLVGLEFRV